VLVTLNAPWTTEGSVPMPDIEVYHASPDGTLAAALETLYSERDRANDLQVECGKRDVLLSHAMATARMSAEVIAEQDTCIAKLEREVRDLKRWNTRLQARIDGLVGRRNERNELRVTVPLIEVLREHTELTPSNSPGCLTGDCPLCVLGTIFCWLDLQDWWCDGCLKSGQVGELLDALDEAGR